MRHESDTHLTCMDHDVFHLSFISGWLGLGRSKKMYVVYDYEIESRGARSESGVTAQSGGWREAGARGYSPSELRMRENKYSTVYSTVQ